MSKKNFIFVEVVGRGGFGKVWRIRHRKTGELFALKEMSKVKIYKKNSVKSVMGENKLLQSLFHPFIVNMKYAFQDRENLYLIMPLLAGGDLRYHIIQRRIFDEQSAKFLICCILIGLDYIHRSKVIHRDIKPENLIFDSRGYLHITDFGVAKLWRAENFEDTSGTPGYMAPEVLCRKDHSYSADLFAVGVILYEFMHGKRPYIGKTRKEIKEAVMSRQVLAKQNTVTGTWSDQAIDFCNGLIQRKRNKRLGERGIEELKVHPWFQGYDWAAVENKTKVPHFVPPANDNFDRKNASRLDSAIEAEDLNLLRNKEVQDLFLDYEFNRESMKRQPSILTAETTACSKTTIFTSAK